MKKIPDKKTLRTPIFCNIIHISCNIMQNPTYMIYIQHKCFYTLHTDDTEYDCNVLLQKYSNFLCLFVSFHIRDLLLVKCFWYSYYICIVWSIHIFNCHAIRNYNQGKNIYSFSFEITFHCIEMLCHTFSCYKVFAKKYPVFR